MTIELGRNPDQILAGVEALLAGMPGDDELGQLPAGTDIDELARRLDEAHRLLVHALESVERG